MTKHITYPPQLSDDQYDCLISDIKDWQATHGSLLKLVETDVEHTVHSYPVGTTLFPSLFPRGLFNEALDLQKTFNKLYAFVAEDEEWLYTTLKEFIEVDVLASILWSIHQEVKRQEYVQDLTLAISRSDYMLHVGSIKSVRGGSNLQLKQVELNTISCAGGVHSNLVSDMHRHLHRTGACHRHPESLGEINADSVNLPPNRTLKTISSGLVAAHRAYGSPKSNALKTCVLFIVQKPNFNIADERPIEYELWDESVPNYRVTFGTDVLNQTTLTPSREILYTPPFSDEALEVSVVYFRSGFQTEEYSDDGREARLRIEISRAIKCPSVLSHLTTFKKVQQALALPESLNRFLSSEGAQTITSTLVPIYPLDSSELGLQARKLALKRATAQNHVLKPSLEGGGHNIYGEDIVVFLEGTPEELWHTYILMERIVSPAVSNCLMSPKGFYRGPVISELGIFGTYLWRRESKGSNQTKIVQEMQPCWTFKTKSASVDEMSVVKGYGCFDSPALVEDGVFSTYIGRE